DNAAIDAMLEGAEAGDALFYPWYELPLARLAKAYSWLLGGFGGQGPVPQGMSARAALRNRAFSDRQRWVAARVAEAAARLPGSRGTHPPTGFSSTCPAPPRRRCAGRLGPRTFRVRLFPSGASSHAQR